jgi:hypothetical protein
MKTRALVMISICLSFSLCACQRGSLDSSSSESTTSQSSRPGSLSNSKAEQALNKWIQSINSSGSIRVVGIQESGPNNARANIQFSNFRYSTKDFGNVVQQEWSGGGLASFIKYNDGRWILSNVYTSQGVQSRWWEGINQAVE